MNLFKINKKLINLPILSFHHGDPSKYRGRPAGFYEILNRNLFITKFNYYPTNKKPHERGA